MRTSFQSFFQTSLRYVTPEHHGIGFTNYLCLSETRNCNYSTFLASAQKMNVECLVKTTNKCVECHSFLDSLPENKGGEGGWEGGRRCNKSFFFFRRVCFRLLLGGWRERERTTQGEPGCKMGVKLSSSFYLA